MQPNITLKIEIKGSKCHELVKPKVSWKVLQHIIDMDENTQDRAIVTEAFLGSGWLLPQNDAEMVYGTEPESECHINNVFHKALTKREEGFEFVFNGIEYNDAITKHTKVIVEKAVAEYIAGGCAKLSDDICDALEGVCCYVEYYQDYKMSDDDISADFYTFGDSQIDQFYRSVEDKTFNGAHTYTYKKLLK